MASITSRAERSLGIGLRRRFAGRPLLVAGFALAVLLTELVLAAAVAEPRASRLLLLVVALAGAAVMFRFPLAVAAVLLVFSASVFHSDYFPRIGPARVHEVIVAGLLAVAVVRPRRVTWGGTPGAALATFFGLLLLANYLAVAAGRVEPVGAVNWSRSLFLVSLFWVVIRLCPDAQSIRRLIAAGAVVASVTAVISVLAALGSSLGYTLQDPGYVFINDNSTLGLLKRVRFPGLGLAYGLFWAVAMLVLHARGFRRAAWAAPLGFLFVIIVFSLNRNMWLGMVGGMVLLLLFGGAAVRTGLVLRVGATAGMVVLLALSTSANVGVGMDSPLRPLIARVGTLFYTPDQVATQDKALQGRKEETVLALQTIGRNLATGIGAGVPYGYHFNEARSGGRYVRVPQKFLHNQWLWLTLVGGLPLVLAWATFLGTLLHHAWRRPRDPLLSALGVGLAMIMVSALVELYFSTDGMTTTIGLVTGLIYAGRAALDDAEAAAEPATT